MKKRLMRAAGLLLTCAVLFWCGRIYSVNQECPMTKTYHMQDTIACDSITLTPTGAYLYSEEEFAEAFGPEAGEVLTALKEWILAEGMEFELLLHRRASGTCNTEDMACCICEPYLF